MKYLSWISLIIAAIVALNEVSYIGESSLAWVLIGLSVSIALLAIEQIARKKEA